MMGRARLNEKHLVLKSDSLDFVPTAKRAIGDYSEQARHKPGPMDIDRTAYLAED